MAKRIDRGRSYGPSARSLHSRERRAGDCAVAARLGVRPRARRGTPAQSASTWHGTTELMALGGGSRRDASRPPRPRTYVIVPPAMNGAYTFVDIAKTPGAGMLMALATAGLVTGPSRRRWTTSGIRRPVPLQWTSRKRQIGS